MIIRLFCTLVFTSLLTFGTAAMAVGNSEYKLASGDVISINVFGEEDLSFKKLRLTDAGTFSYPFIGEVQAKGRTAAEIEQLLVSKLKGDYLVNPRVSVGVLQYRDFFISGEVLKPGGYPFQPGLTLRRAIALAGGLTERASEKKITIVHDQEPTKAPDNVGLDTPLMPGDSVTVPEGFF
jgi:protein involved in polysaccharide export with SLBB domain